MSDTTKIAALLDRWFGTGNESAFRRAYEELGEQMVAPPEVLAVLGRAFTDEIRQDVLIHLLDRTDGKLRGVQAPAAYAKVAWRRAIASALRKWGPRNARASEVRRYVSSLAEGEVLVEIEERIDAARAIAIAERLSRPGRLAVLLTSRPDRIANEDWRSLVASLPPPSPPPPQVALDRDEASRLLYPPQDPESAKMRHQRLNSFDKAYKRALAQIRQALEEDP